MSLPRFIAIRSQEGYLRFHPGRSLEIPAGLLRFSEARTLTPYTKFELVQRDFGEGEILVHIRCCYSNKYLARYDHNSNLIVAKAENPEEDRGKSSCTLFRPEYVDEHHFFNQTYYRFRHIQLGLYVAPQSDGHHVDCLYAVSADPDDRNKLYVVDWDNISIMSKHVAFKGDNGKYLAGCWIDGKPYLQFSSDDIGEKEVAHEITLMHSDSVCIKSAYFGMLWRCDPDSNWVFADTDEVSWYPEPSVFVPIKVENTTVALYDIQSSRFLKRLTAGSKTSCLSASEPVMSSCFSHFKVEEVIFAREIYNVQFHFEDAWIYDQRIVTLDSKTETNPDKEPKARVVKLSYTKVETSTWNNNIIRKSSDVRTTIETDIPHAEDGQVIIISKFKGKYKWGETMNSTAKVESDYEITIPAMSTVTVKVIGRVNSCHVPFSYSQRDSLFNGEPPAIDRMEDGIYTSTYCYGLNFEIEEEE